MPARARQPAAETLRVGGITPLTTIDFPGKLAAVVFCQGCPWRCGYCHNPGLLDATQPGPLDWDDVLALLRQRHGLLDGVVFSGGEPLAQSGLPDALARVGVRRWAVQECRTPHSALWSLTANQVMKMTDRFAVFALRRG